MTRAAPIRPPRELKSDAGDAERCPAELVDEIAGELNYLRDSFRTPEAFLERRDLLVRRLRRLAKRLRGGTLSAPPAARAAAVWRPRIAPTETAAFRAVKAPAAARDVLRLKERP